jgi:hypothetical protein
MVRLALAALVAGAFLSIGCATTTKIVSEPPGAEVYDAAAAKGAKPLGKTPMSYEFKGWMWDTAQLKVQAPGYKAKTVDIKRTELDMLPTVGGAALCVCVPCLGWVGGPLWFLAGGMKLPEETKVKLDREGAPAEAPPVGMREESAAPVVALRY